MWWQWQQCQSTEGKVLRPTRNKIGQFRDILLSAYHLGLLLLLLHPFNGLFSRTTWISWHQKGKPFWILLEQEIMGWHWHQLDHMQIICTSLQTDNYGSTLLLSFYRPDALPAAQPTASKHRRQPLITQVSTEETKSKTRHAPVKLDTISETVKVTITQNNNHRKLTPIFSCFVRHSWVYTRRSRTELIGISGFSGKFFPQSRNQDLICYDVIGY